MLFLSRMLAVLCCLYGMVHAAPSPDPVDPIWRPVPRTTWEWQLSSTATTPGNIPVDASINASVYDIDLFFTSQEDIDLLHSMGRKVICYFSAGTWEPWRWDAMGFPSDSLGRSLEAWEDEKYLDVTDIASIAPFIRSRLDLAMTKKCDGVEPDNVDAYQLPASHTGFNITEDDMVEYLQWLSIEAHQRNLSIALKNNLPLVNRVVDWFDFSIAESCNTFGDAMYDCSNLLPFIQANKAVFGAEYFDTGYNDWELNYTPQLCEAMNNAGYSWIVKSQALTPHPYYSCQTNILTSLDPPFNGPLSPHPSNDTATGPASKQAAFVASAASAPVAGCCTALLLVLSLVLVLL